MKRKISDIGEFALIEKITKGLRLSNAVIKGVGDDCAVLKFTRDKYLLLTTDIFVENTHFILKDTLKGTSALKDTGAPPFQIGWKALAANVSDIAAMGGIPKDALISLALPSNYAIRMVEGIYRGIKAVARGFGINIVGGDTSRADKLIINISLLGEVKKKHLVLRSGARRGDIIFVTGSLGGSIYGKHIRFIPRIKEAQLLVKSFKLHSMIDLSDGLSSDLNHIARESDVGALIYEQSIPLSRDARSIKQALNMGEDFELLFTLSPAEAKKLLRKKPRGIVIPLTRIGEIRDKRFDLKLITKKGREKELRQEGFRHF